MSKSAAIELARTRGMDLILVAPNTQPPVVRILDYGKYKYEISKREQKAKKNQKIIEVKEMKFRIGINEHDYQTKLKHIKRFIEDGNKVKVTVMFRGRELAFTEKVKRYWKEFRRTSPIWGTSKRNRNLKVEICGWL